MKLKIHYAWIVLLLAFIALLSAQGVRLSFGAFVNPWEEDFQAGRSVISFIAFLSYVVYGISQPMVGKLIDKFGVRKILAFSILLIGISTLFTYFATSTWHLMVIYGVIASIGFGGASNVAGSVAITNWFKEKRGFALGLMSAGNATGQLLLVPLSLFLIKYFGWNNTVLILGGFLLIFVFPLLLIFVRNKPRDKGLLALGDLANEKMDVLETVEKAKKSISFFALLKRKEFLFLMIPFFICGFTTSGLIDTHLIPFAQSCGFKPSTTGTAVTLLAFFNIIGTIIIGHVTDRLSCKKILAFMYGVRALSLVLLIVIVNVPTLFGLAISKSYVLMIFGIMFGIVDFGTVAPTFKLATEFFKEYSIGVIFGWLSLSHQIGSAVGAYLPGIFFDMTNSYESAFIYSIILLIISIVLNLFLPNPSKIKVQMNGVKM